MSSAFPGKHLNSASFKSTAVSLNLPEFIIRLDMPRGWGGRKGEKWVSPVSVLAGLGSHWPARDRFPLLMLRNQGYLHASSYTVFHQEKRLTLAEVCLANSCACFWWADGCQCARQLCEAASTWDNSSLQLFYTATERQGKAAWGNKSIWNHRDLLGEGESFKLHQRGKFLHYSSIPDLLFY